WCDSEMTQSLPPAVIHAEDEEIMSALPNLDPKLKGPEPLDAVPLRVVPGDEFVPVKEQSICSFPQSLKSLESYKEEDWTAFLHTRVDGHKDWVKPDIFRKVREEFRPPIVQWLVTIT
uniref:Uncharacterized protein n=1 Tax=Setaria italica TaxID=4555 RepID=K3ZLR0_SETIT